MEDRLEWLHLERRIRYWTAQTRPIRKGEAERLLATAAVLREWREAKPYFAPPETIPPWEDAEEEPALGPGPTPPETDT